MENTSPRCYISQKSPVLIGLKNVCILCLNDAQENIKHFLGGVGRRGNKTRDIVWYYQILCLWASQ